MINLYLQGPKWFLGVAASLETFAAIIAFLVALASFRVYRLLKEQKYLHFTAGFALLTLSFASRAAADTLLQGAVVELPQRIAGYVFFAGYLLHILLALSAYLLLVIITHKISDKRVMALIFLALLTGLGFSGSYFISFYVYSFIFLAFVTLAYFQNYHAVRSKASLLVFAAFLLLTLSQAQFLLERTHDLIYITANITQALGYFTLLSALIAVIIKSRKK